MFRPLTEGWWLVRMCGLKEPEIVHIQTFDDKGQQCLKIWRVGSEECWNGIALTEVFREIVP